MTIVSERWIKGKNVTTATGNGEVIGDHARPVSEKGQNEGENGIGFAKNRS